MFSVCIEKWLAHNIPYVISNKIEQAGILSSSFLSIPLVGSYKEKEWIDKPFYCYCFWSEKHNIEKSRRAPERFVIYTCLEWGAKREAENADLSQLCELV
jgi:hypothetical protein